MKTDYPALCSALAAITEGVLYEIPNLANAAALLWEYLPNINWAGFYKMTDGKLVLGPFQGKTACIVIEIGRGVCGTAAEKDCTQLVPNVHEFPSHIACDCASNSEIVIPIHKNGTLWGVLDMDSPSLCRFSEEDKNGLEEFVRILEKAI